MKPSPRAQLFKAWPGSAWLSLGLQAGPYKYCTHISWQCLRIRALVSNWIGHLVMVFMGCWGIHTLPLLLWWLFVNSPGQVQKKPVPIMQVTVIQPGDLGEPGIPTPVIGQ
ncbi:hypothetical protein ARMGADRAFT_1022987 [Armillaria gallica]|uniref:Uncharacterized protein n=1 Tax=Armillaria gallica TaxID=47427 RepID=A0A2H3EEI8_ARMGA|nr:hypothetical protein ARMGADRAFT_1022987 [Armillaria gallica]